MFLTSVSLSLLLTLNRSRSLSFLALPSLSSLCFPPLPPLGPISCCTSSLLQEAPGILLVLALACSVPIRQTWEGRGDVFPVLDSEPRPSLVGIWTLSQGDGSILSLLILK